jgi:hypothetical protein
MKNKERWIRRRMKKATKEIRREEERGETKNVYCSITV